ncbi:MAG: FHA domain-containing protein [Oscillospiraceae bacterium]|nr:FHA domain-containing protein [Oscillospiraceae bacterium]
MSLSDGGGEDAPHLIRSRNNERIKLSKPVFRIGKERSFADYFISDNTAVSRGHAEFTSRGGEYFVSDMNSTNHTYVNDEMLAGGTAARIRHGDKIRLADEEFEFRLY